MSHLKMKKQISLKSLLPVLLAAMTLACSVSARAAVPGITGPTFNLTASADYITQPDGQSIYSWGYGCAAPPSGFAPAAFAGIGTCPAMQLPGPTLIVNEGDTVTVSLTDALPAPAGNTSIVFAGGFQTTSTGGVAGLLTQEAAPGNPVTYSFVASRPGTYSYYSGTRPDLQVEMGLYGALIVLPKTVPSSCKVGPYSLSGSAYDHPQSCYDREYLFQFSEMSLEVHQSVEAAVRAGTPGPISVNIEPYHPVYFMINGRSMPDDMDGSYLPNYPHQPYNGNPHMHPGEQVLMRVIGQGRWQHPFHFHGNHARVLGRDGTLIVSQSDSTVLAGPLLFTIATVSGQSVDALWTWTGQGLNWDVYGSDSTHAHTCNGLTIAQGVSAGFDPVSHEYCPDHGKPIPVTPPDSNIVANGLWYGGSPYLGTPAGTQLPVSADVINPYGSYAYMWHSHNEREITTNDIFPGGMMMMAIVDSATTPIDERQ
jgi:FtsP/CotA-like multicopper oxidase with cupredoxin domain